MYSSPGGKDHYLRLWDPQRMQLRSEHRRSGTVTCVTGGGAQLYTGCGDGSVTGIDVNTLKEKQYQGHPHPIRVRVRIRDRIRVRVRVRVREELSRPSLPLSPFTHTYIHTHIHSL